jgi:hypothetical protein
VDQAVYQLDVSDHHTMQVHPVVACVLPGLAQKDALLQKQFLLGPCQGCSTLGT